MSTNEPITSTHMTPQEQPPGKTTNFGLPRTIHLVPLDYISGYEVRPGFYEINGATAYREALILQYIPMGPHPLNYCCFTGQRRSLSPSFLSPNTTESAMSIP